ncbi:hypothetical protein [Brevundimonas sp.]|uniref:hypothetical protein n=1 Tax=Brevundimonas sp. TaxID=1871086 RepID=UPI0027315CD1|nr:hypothetical protein [Brevundimonas sp.]MDP1912635.1 hypothetical protein [Brevundimonas sp.]
MTEDIRRHIVDLARTRKAEEEAREDGKRRALSGLADMKRDVEQLLATVPETRLMRDPTVHLGTRTGYHVQEDNFWHSEDGPALLVTDCMVFYYNPHSGRWWSGLHSHGPQSREEVFATFKHQVARWVVDKYPAIKAAEPPQQEPIGCALILAPVLLSGLFAGGAVLVRLI